MNGKKAPRRPRPRAAHTTDPHLVSLEASLDKYREISRKADEQLAALAVRETAIRAETHLPRGPVVDTLTLGAVVSLKEHFEALREADFRFYEERDRRYSEGNVEREKALKIKETADLAALSLAREIQDYKDEKANNLRSQIEGERGHYSTKEDTQAMEEKFRALLKPVADWVQLQQGGGVVRAESLQENRWSERQRSQRSEWLIGLLVAGGIAVAGLFLAIAQHIQIH